MKVVIDTSSLISLVRYYLPFDKEGKLFQTIQSKVESGEIIVLDKVVEECKYISGGIIVTTLSLLLEKKNQEKTNELLPNKAFFNMLENQFVNPAIKRKLSPTEFESKKIGFLESADAKILLFSNSQKKSGADIVVVTEESTNNNDNKAFKKIPAICEILEIKCLSLPQLLQTYQEIEVRF
ncbi:MAG: DUF4411 family protein [Bacteroidales bacterium]